MELGAGSRELRARRVFSHGEQKMNDED